MSNIQTQLDYADAIAEWFLEIGEAHNLHGNLEEGMKCAYVAATIFSRQNRSLSSARLESSLQFIAGRLTECSSPQVIAPLKTDQKEICLHVMSEALPTGGISSMVTRWINNDRNERVHSLVLLEKQLPIPEVLLQAIAETGGSVYIANPVDSILHKAVWLRTLINKLATAVILHIDVSDVICGVALGTTGGPPVLLVNYTAHSFWTGASIADLVLNVRGSALEKLWTAEYRGISRYATLPIPLLEPSSLTSDSASYAELKHQAKQSIGIPVNSVVILTVGASFKFLPTKTLDFVEECESILKQLPDGFLLVVGFDGDSRWRKASSRLGSRIRTLGTVSQAKLAIIHEATDLYIEGFPFGTTTSLLEAGLKGIPVVLAPAQCPPPYGSDGVALDNILERPTTLDDYHTKIIRLARNPVERKYQGEKIRNSVAIHHTGLGWSRYLKDALARLPLEHSTEPSITPIWTPETINEYWATFIAKIGSGYEETLELAISRALSIGVRPRLTRSVQQACKHYKSIRIHRTIPLPLIIFLCNFLLQIIPISWAHNIFRLFSFLCRPSLLSRVRSKLPPLLGGTERPCGMYAEYRKVKKPSELSFKKEKPI
jgi:hypothetical protein